MNALSGLDIALLAALALSVFIGLFRGLIYELMSLAGWVVAYVASLALAPALGSHLPIGEPGSALNQAAAISLCFVAALIAWGLVARLIRMLITASALTVPDRALGAAFGLVRGLVLLLVFATVVSLTPAARADLWVQSRGAQWLGVALQGLRPLLPEAVARWLPASAVAS